MKKRLAKIIVSLFLTAAMIIPMAAAAFADGPMGDGSMGGGPMGEGGGQGGGPQDQQQVEEAAPEEAAPVDFKDVLDASAYYYDAVYWLRDNGIAKGYNAYEEGGRLDGCFGIDENCSRGQFVLMLWRFMGKPESGIEKNPFPDLNPKASYYDAVLWAYSKGMIKGYAEGLFRGDDPITRGQIVTILYKMEGKPSVKAANAFTDVSGRDLNYNYQAILWGYDKGLVKGYTADKTFRPNNNCLRRDLAIILYRFSNMKPVDTRAAIQNIKVLGIVDMDGSKPAAIVAEYNVELKDANIGIDTFKVTDYGLTLNDNDLDTGSDAGKALKVYVNDTPEITETPSGSGKYVIIEVNTNYSVGRFTRSWLATMAASVTQVRDIICDTFKIAADDEAVSNSYVYEYIGINPMTGGFRDPEYYDYANEGTYTIDGIEGYELHMIASDAEKYVGTGVETMEPFKATHCFDEGNGQYWDFDLPYALYVPEDYDPAKEYALILHIHDAGSMDTNPMLTLCEAQGPRNYASKEVQDLFKAQGLGGAIVVCPAISETFYMDEENPTYNLRISRDNWTLSCAAPAVWQLMDSLTEKYNVDTNRIYGSGQSMGGMTVMAMAAQRDNYFAALLPLSCKWGQNFDKDVEFNGQVYYNAPADDVLIYTKDSDGNPVDYNNWFYLISDDNMLFYSTAGENNEYQVMYKDLCGQEVKQIDMILDENSVSEEGKAARNQMIKDLTSQEYELGIYQVNLGGNVGHMSAWFYGHSTFASYEWLAAQTRETEMARAKLDLNKDFERAEVQLTDDMHVAETGRDGTVTYYPTGKLGAGTIGYNSGCSALGSSAKLAPGWTADENGNVIQ